MGVMACNRNGCGNVMCDYHSSSFGYICIDCRGELVGTRGTMTIGQFMVSPKQQAHDSDPYAWGSYVNRIFEVIE